MGWAQLRGLAGPGPHGLVGWLAEMDWIGHYYIFTNIISDTIHLYTLYIVHHTLHNIASRLTRAARPQPRLGLQTTPNTQRGRGHAEPVNAAAAAYKRGTPVARCGRYEKPPRDTVIEIVQFK